MEKINQLIDNVERVLFGKRQEVVQAVVGLLAEGHILLEDVPGTGKTTLARALARSVDARFRRIQFTSDMLPSDVLGVSVYDSQAGSFRFQRGPIFGNVILADELNRTTPRTQSSLLECMNEGQVSVDGTTEKLPAPFLVIATQNPLEYEGTYPLPESQLDRFLLRIRLGYPGREHEREILLSQVNGHPLDQLEPVLGKDEVLAAIRKVRDVHVERSLVDYILDFVEATRSSSRIALGASPRAALGLYRASQALALICGRDYCVPDDIKQLILPVLGHRVIARQADARHIRSSEEALLELMEELPVPS